MKKRHSLITRCAVTIAFALCAPSWADVDYRSLVSRADLDYTTPTTRSEEGQPIGNGRMGSLVWTTPSAMHLQINRVDVFAEDSYTTSFPKQDSDYASDCAYIDVNVADAGPDVFAGGAFRQHLSLYDGTMALQGQGVSARLVAWPRHDVIAIEVDDERVHPEAINVDLRMLRYAIQEIPGKNYALARSHTVEVHTAEHTAASTLDIRDGRIALAQHFSEHEFHDASAVAIGVLGRESRARYLNESTVQLSAAPGKGRFTILIASAASIDPNADVTALALKELAPAQSFEAVSADTQSWWHDFWSKGYVSMHSPDGQADFVEQNYTYFLYIMGCTSHGGAYPPRFGGLLFYTNGDMRRWGSQYWWANTSAYYANLMPANRLELLDPMFTMYTRMLDACALAARQQWGSNGIWIPEITFFNGPEKLPDDIAAELQDLMLLRKPFDQRSAHFLWWAETKNRHNARWNFLGDGHWEHGHYVVPTKGAGIFGHCTHILSDAAKIGNLYYQRYLFTGDKDWLRDRAYPVVKGAAEFYRNLPDVRKDADGVYHIDHVNNGESNWDTSDTANEIGGMGLAFANAIRVSSLLGVDADLRPKWQDILDHLASPKSYDNVRHGAGAAAARNGAPTTRPPRVNRNAGTRPFGAFVYGGPGAIPPNEPDAKQKARFLGFDALGSFIDAAGTGGAQILRNRLRLREGPGAIDAEHIAGLASGIHATLLSSDPDDNGNVTIEVFNEDWPRSWDCSFQLLARGGFLVSSSVANRQIESVRVLSQLGGPCRVKNPWPGRRVTLQRDGKSESLVGDLLTFDTGRGESIVLAPANGAR
jgi:hypothetical protein